MTGFDRMRSLAAAEARQYDFDPFEFEDEIIEDAARRGMTNLNCRHADSICYGMYLATDTEGQYIPGTIVISAHQYSGDQRLEFALDDPTKARYVFERTLVYARDRGYDTSGFFNKGAGALALQDEQF